MEQRQKIAAAALTAGTVCAAYSLLTRYYAIKAASLVDSHRPRSGSNNFLQFFISNQQQAAGAPQTGKAGTAVTYDWAQSLEEVLIEMRVPPHVCTADVSVKLEQSHLLVTVGQQCVINGPLTGRIEPCSSTWQLEGRGSRRMLSITLCKAPPLGTDERFSIWTSLLQGSDDSCMLPDQQ